MQQELRACSKRLESLVWWGLAHCDWLSSLQPSNGLALRQFTWRFLIDIGLMWRWKYGSEMRMIRVKLLQRETQTHLRANRVSDVWLLGRICFNHVECTWMISHALLYHEKWFVDEFLWIPKQKIGRKICVQFTRDFRPRFSLKSSKNKCPWEILLQRHCNNKNYYSSFRNRLINTCRWRNRCP